VFVLSATSKRKRRALKCACASKNSLFKKRRTSIPRLRPPSKLWALTTNRLSKTRSLTWPSRTPSLTSIYSASLASTKIWRSKRECSDESIMQKTAKWLRRIDSCKSVSTRWRNGKPTRWPSCSSCSRSWESLCQSQSCNRLTKSSRSRDSAPVTSTCAMLSL